MRRKPERILGEAMQLRRDVLHPVGMEYNT